MTIEEQIKYWSDSAEQDIRVAEHLFEKRDYAWCLFLGHLVLEKILKAVYIQEHNVVPPKIHDVVRLAKAVHLPLSPEQEEFLFKTNRSISKHAILT